jgi:hypothetical protein
MGGGVGLMACCVPNLAHGSNLIGGLQRLCYSISIPAFCENLERSGFISCALRKQQNNPGEPTFTVDILGRSIDLAH